MKEEINNESKYSEMDKLISILSSLIEKDEAALILQSWYADNYLQCGVEKEKMETYEFRSIDGIDFWDFIYAGIVAVAPDSVVNFMKIGSNDNSRIAAIIEVNGKVNAIIDDKQDKYQDWLNSLREYLMSESEIIEQKDIPGHRLRIKARPFNN